MLWNNRLARPGAIFDSFVGLLDIKSGAEIILLFGVLNKVAGVYGLVSAFFGGSLTQLSFYIYSTVTLIVLVWGLKAVAQESSSKSLKLAYLYALDHLVQTLYTIHFANVYWYQTPHDGRRIINSQAQQDLIDLAISRGEVSAIRENIEEVAEELWRAERTTAFVCLVGIWFLKVYFIAVLFSYAAHLRSKTYHTLPLSSSSPNPNQQSIVDQYASTAPYEPTHPLYQAHIHGLNDEAPIASTSNDAREREEQQHGTNVDGVTPGGGNEEFKWESDEEASGSGKHGSR